ncbi:MAG: DUF2062 domain-containing protein [Cytophagaceae bacterium]
MKKLVQEKYRAIKAKLVGYLKMGLSDEKIALSIALGSVISVFPIIGTTTIICAGIALILRLNQGLIQLANYVVYPMQLILIIPFFKMGAGIFSDGNFNMPLEELVLLFKSDLFSAFKTLSLALLCAVGAWGLIAPFVAGVIYFLVLFVLRKRRKLQMLNS